MTNKELAKKVEAVEKALLCLKPHVRDKVFQEALKAIEPEQKEKDDEKASTEA